MQGVIGSLNALAGAFSELSHVLEGALIGNNTIELSPDEYEISDSEKEKDDAISDRTNLLDGSV